MRKTVFNLVAGLPGSGKSTVCARAAEKIGAIFIDDPRDFDRDVLAKVVPGRVHIIADCHLCTEVSRGLAFRKIHEQFRDAAIFFVFFEKNPTKCMENLRIRQMSNDNRDVAATVKIYARTYEIPKGMKTVRIWQKGTESNEAEFIQLLGRD